MTSGRTASRAASSWQICSAYFSRQPEPVQALRIILTIQDFDRFLATSEYNGDAPEIDPSQSVT